MERLLTSDDVADLLRVDVVTVRRLVSRGELAAYRIGSEFRFSMADVEAFVQRQRVSHGDSNEGHQERDGSKWSLDVQMSGDRFHKFTKRAALVLSLAQEEAINLKHNFIGPEHLLYALAREGEGIAAKVLQRQGVIAEIVHQHIIMIHSTGDKTETTIGLTPRAKKVIELAVEEARAMEHKFIGTEHLLLGLLREQEGPAFDILNSLNVDTNVMREQIIQILQHVGGLRANRNQSEPDQFPAPPPVPPEAAELVPTGTTGQVCAYCKAFCPVYFQYCFNCGTKFILS